MFVLNFFIIKLLIDLYVCAKYYFQNIESLSRFNEPCDDIGECYQDDQMYDFRADNNVPYQCALYSFCPDPCCPLRNVTIPITCNSVNPCRHNMVENKVYPFNPL